MHLAFLTGSVLHTHLTFLTCDAPDVLDVGDDVEKELLGETRLAGDHQALQVVAVVTDELEDGRLRQHGGVAEIERSQPRQLARARQLQQDLATNRSLQRQLQ